MTLQPSVSRCAQASAELDPLFEEQDDDWEEFDPTSLESWILDDFDWEIEEGYPQRGDFLDDERPLREIDE